MFSRDKGKSKSKKPFGMENPKWVNYSKEELEALILKFTKEGISPSQVGLVLRDTYGIPCVKTIIGMPIVKFLLNNNTAGEIPEDLLCLLKKIVFLKKHLEKNKKDQPAKRGLRLTESKIARLVTYYKNKKRLSSDWTYDIDKIRFLTE